MAFLARDAILMRKERYSPRRSRQREDSSEIAGKSELGVPKLRIRVAYWLAREATLHGKNGSGVRRSHYGKSDVTRLDRRARERIARGLFLGGTLRFFLLLRLGFLFLIALRQNDHRCSDAPRKRKPAVHRAETFAPA